MSQDGYGPSLNCSSCRGRWRERSCPRSATSVHSVVADRTPNLPIETRTLCHWAIACILFLHGQDNWHPFNLCFFLSLHTYVFSCLCIPVSKISLRRRCWCSCNWTKTVEEHRLLYLIPPVLYVVSTKLSSLLKGNLQKYCTTVTAVLDRTNVKCYSRAVAFVPSTAEEQLDEQT